MELDIPRADDQFLLLYLLIIGAYMIYEDHDDS